jgi:predicted DNA-binding ribbon-helix-helix protein
MPPPKAPRRKSLVVKRSIILGGRGGHKTSVGLEDAFWVALKSIAAAQGSSAAQLIDRIDNERRERQRTNLSSAIRLFVLAYYRSAASERAPFG